MKKILILFFFLQLVSAVRAQQDYNVVFVGNSITFGALHKNPKKTAPPIVCGQWLARQPGAVSRDLD